MTSGIVALAVAAVLRPAAGQGTLPPASGTPGVPGEMRSVEGRVLRGGRGDPRPVAGQMVVLHRIAADSAGPVDSMRTPATGRYRFQYRLASTTSMYIVSSRYAGVAYFTTPLRAATVAGPDGDLLVYDTTSRVFPLTVRGRHFVVAPPDPSGIRRVVDVFEVANDSTVTLVTGGTTDATWTVRLPAGIRDPQIGGGDVPAEAMRFSGGVASLFMPFPPGERQVVLTYGVPAGTGLDVPVESGAATLEVLVEGGGATAAGAGLAVQPTVSMEGRTFQRYLSDQVAPGAAFNLRLAGGSFGGRAGRLVLLAGAVVVLALGIVFGRRPSAGAPAGAPREVQPRADALARAIVALDTVYADPSRQDAAAQGAYRVRREALKAQLTTALPVEDGDSAQ